MHFIAVKLEEVFYLFIIFRINTIMFYLFVVVTFCLYDTSCNLHEKSSLLLNWDMYFLSLCITKMNIWLNWGSEGFFEKHCIFQLRKTRKKIGKTRT